MHGMQVFKTYIDVKTEHPDIDDWLSESVSAEFGTDMTDIIQTAIVCFNTDRPWEEFQVFEKVTLVINGRTVFSEFIQELSIREISYAVGILKKLFSEKDFNDTVSKYIAIVATQEGMAILPENLAFAQRLIPVTYLSREQEQIQAAYLREVEDYVGLMDGSVV